jgi:tRNA(Ile)-lysidine synthase TilS/MesJ
MPRAVALLSGGLDSMLAVRIVQQQGFTVAALNIRTVFECCRNDAARAADLLGIPLTVLSLGDDYLQIIRRPRFGYGRGMNPCIDCRIAMCQAARRLLDDSQAQVVITGEVLGQRPMSQKRQDLATIAKHSGLPGRLLRPLSAQLLPPTIVEQEGLIDRAGLHGFHGTGRSGLIALARRLGIPEAPAASHGCALTESSVAARLRDLFRHRPRATRWDLALARRGRHYRYSDSTKIVLARDAGESAWLEDLFRQPDATPSALLDPANFPGPAALVVGDSGDAALQFAGALILLRARRYDPADAQVRLVQAGRAELIRVAPQEAARAALTVQ